MIEETITNILRWLKLFVETVGAFFIGVGANIRADSFLKVVRSPSESGYESTRLCVGHRSRGLYLGVSEAF